MSQAGAWTWLQPTGHGDMQGFDSSFAAVCCLLLSQYDNVIHKKCTHNAMTTRSQLKHLATKSGHPESNQGPSDVCSIYSQMLYQLSYSRKYPVNRCQFVFTLKQHQMIENTRTYFCFFLTTFCMKSFSTMHLFQNWFDIMAPTSNEPGRTRTCNPRLRRPMPYPLGHGSIELGRQLESVILTSRSRPMIMNE